jgi:hypothetical protein
MLKKLERIKEKLAREQARGNDDPKQMETALRRLHEGTYRSVILHNEYWKTNFSHELHVHDRAAEQAQRHRASVPQDSLRTGCAHLARAGYCICPKVDWGSDISHEKMVRAMGELKSKGWPACFVFAYRQPWTLIERLFDVVEPIFGQFLAFFQATCCVFSVLTLCDNLSILCAVCLLERIDEDLMFTSIWLQRFAFENECFDAAKVLMC